MDLELEGFCNALRSKFSVIAREEEVGWENTEHYRDELDMDLFPTVVYGSLPDPCLFQVMIFTDEDLNEWMSIVPIHPSTKERLYIIWLKNLEVVDWEK
ncbi:hypothetical protein P4159_02685 [Bacillus thuringiensis]|uniref:hypothetical protein n=1 Tax=Bacillus thuringiensis TaxID=1428 RepID=UPI0007C1CB5B|nr:hypothetical protein [Bacillus thuringiensis]AND10780.1 hypothetical protein Bt4C1_27355 [Bacillus thuringiensis serovar alesti]MEC3594168.1 hypothetical protein [Bacillus thuringiensis]MED1834867.1 hypothetical protein [Bacillus thuringiensis]MED2207018.1 hypothetical protein [Bacillus thuringiensis]MED2669638.1 hypothetical protein [Bacillus thuringiensis]